MANQNVTLNSKDPIVQAMQAVDRAKTAYDNAGYHRNFLEQKAKKGDAHAKAELPEAQKNVERAQEKLKQAQTQLARLTGGLNPHRKQPAPKLLEEKSGPTQTSGTGEETRVAKKDPPKKELGPNQDGLGQYVEFVFEKKVFEPYKRGGFYEEIKLIPTQFKDPGKLRDQLRKLMKEQKKTLPNGEILYKAKS